MSSQTPSSSLRALAVPALVGLAAGLLAACHGESGAPPVRLVELRQGTEVVWPELDEAPPKDAPLSPIGDLPEPGRVAEVLMHEGEDAVDSRTSLLVPPGGLYRFRLTVPPRSVLRLGLGYVVRPETEARRLRLAVTLTPEDGPPTQLLAADLMTRGDGAWQDHEIPLADWAGQQVALELRAEGDGQDGEIPWAAFAVPEVVGAELVEDGLDVILISLDTLRADHLTSYGYFRPTSAHIDAFAANGFRFALAVSQSPWTRPSHRSLLTGQYPLSRGPQRAPPLALQLWRAGYRTGAITGGGQVSLRFGFHQGFESYRMSHWVRSLADVTRWLDEAPGRRQFLFLHTFEIHDPYEHAGFTDGLTAGRLGPRFAKQDYGAIDRRPTQEEKEWIKALYDGDILYTDEKLGELFAELGRRGLDDRALIILTSDHGEQFWEHDSWRHGSTMFDHQLLVPLIVHVPEKMRRRLGGPRVIEEQVRLIDVVPTILDLVGLPIPPQVQGRTLRPLLEGRAMKQQLAFSENTNVPREKKALRSQRMKFVYSFHKNPKAGRWEKFQLFDLARDPGEQHDLSAQRPDLVADLKAEIERIMSGAAAVEFDQEVPEWIDPELRKELAALGYLGLGQK